MASPNRRDNAAKTTYAAKSMKKYLALICLWAFPAFAQPAAVLQPNQVLATPTTGPGARPLTPTDSPPPIPGYVGNGGSHPLSSVTSFGTLNSTNWTLAQWQAALPATVALSDEIDGVAINSYIAAASGPVTIRFPPGIARLSRPIASCAQSVSLFGSGPHGTILNFLDSDGWDHCQSSTPTDTKIEARDIQFHSLTTGGALFGIRASFIQDKNILMDDVELNGFNSCIDLTNAAGARIKDTWCYSGMLAGTETVGDGIAIRGVNTFVEHIQDSLMQNYTTAYKFTSINALPTVGVEDVSIINCACGAVSNCVQILANSPNYSPLNYSIINMSADAAAGFVNADQVAGLLISGGDWLVDAPVGSWTGVGQDFFRFRRAMSVRLLNTWISNNALTLTINSYIHVLGTFPASDVQIVGNKFEYHNLTVSLAQIAVDAAARAVIERDSIFTDFFVPTAPPANACSFLPTGDLRSLSKTCYEDRLTKPIRFPIYSVAALPACNINETGLVASVYDGLAPTYGNAIVGGGSVVTLVMCNSGAWIAH
jgi:hypothetical protein